MTSPLAGYRRLQLAISRQCVRLQNGWDAVVFFGYSQSTVAACMVVGMHV